MSNPAEHFMRSRNLSASAGCVILALLFISFSNILLSGAGTSDENTDDTTVQEVVRQLPLLYNERDYSEILTLTDPFAQQTADKELLYYRGLASFNLYRQINVHGEAADSDLLTDDLLSHAVSALKRYELVAQGQESLKELSTVRGLLAVSYYYAAEYEKAEAVAEKALQTVSASTESGTEITSTSPLQQKLEFIIAVSQMHSGHAASAYAYLLHNKFSNPLITFRAAYLAGEPQAELILVPFLAGDIAEKDRYVYAMALMNEYVRQKEYDKAAQAARSLHEMLSSPLLRSSVYYMEGLIHEKKGDLIRARTVWNRAVELNPENTFARDKLE